MKTWLQRGLVTGGAVLCIGFAGCSSDEFTAASGGGSGDGGPDSASGGTGGTADGGGGASGGGTGGTGGTVQTCGSPADCDNGKACDGKEDCVSGKCVAGTSPCENPDTANCDTACDESTGSVQCSVVAKDADGDGHGTLQCKSAPGDDCDDDNKAVFPGQTEACDGLDANCNGKADIDDGFSLSGTVQDLIVSTNDAREPAIAWSPHANVYGVAWQDLRTITTGDEEIYFVIMDQTGAKKSSELRVSNASDESSAAQVAWGNDSFAVVWADSRVTGDGPGIYFRRISETGTAATAEINLTKGVSYEVSFPSIVAVPTGWAVFWEDHKNGDGEIRGRLITADGGTSGGEKTFATAAAADYLPRAANSNGDLGIVWSTSPSTGSTPNVIEMARTSEDLTPNGTPQALTLVSPPSGQLAYLPRIAAAEGGWLTAWHASGGGQGSVSYAAVSNTGAVACGPKNTTTFEADALPNALALMGGERLIAVVDKFYGGTPDTSKVSLARFGAGCTELPALEVAAGQTILPAPTTAAMASGSKGAAVVWQALSGTHRRIRVRTFGPHLCD